MHVFKKLRSFVICLIFMGFKKQGVYLGLSQHGMVRNIRKIFKKFLL